jgi:hypothetical protein
VSVLRQSNERQLSMPDLLSSCARRSEQSLLLVAARGSCGSMHVRATRRAAETDAEGQPRSASHCALPAANEVPIGGCRRQSIESAVESQKVVAENQVRCRHKLGTKVR